MKWFHCYCNENHFRYYLIEGSMLGAARHNGFIPWDDDIDVGMPRRDYEALKHVMGTEIHDGRFLLETEDSEKKEYLYPFSKLYDVTTTVIERRKLEMKRGVCIDIFPLDGIGDTEQDAFKNFKKIGFFHDILAARVVAVRKGRKWYKNGAVRLFQALPQSLICEKKLLATITELCKLHDFDSSAFVGNLVSTYRKKEIIPRDFYGNPTLYDFEGLSFYGVEDYDGYLTSLYGDWKTPPPIDKRNTAHLWDYVDLQTPFMDVCD